MNEQTSFLLNVRDLAEQIGAQVEGHNHLVALSALLAAYATLADQCPSCRPGAAAAALQLGADMTFNPAGLAGPIH